MNLDVSVSVCVCVTPPKPPRSGTWKGGCSTLEMFRLFGFDKFGCVSVSVCVCHTTKAVLEKEKRDLERRLQYVGDVSAVWI